MTDTTSAIPVEIWHGCYDAQWRGLMTSEAFAHPAKFAPGLIERIYRHGLAAGWWRKGETIGDPFGGVAGGGILAGYCGLNWVGVELEQKFVDLGNTNLERHGPKWLAMGDATRVALVQGDSRRFAEICLELPVRGQTYPACADAIVTSPPYADGGQGGGPDSNPDRLEGTAGRSISLRDGYGNSAGQIGELAVGSVEGIVTSPPYDAGLGHGYGAKMREGDAGRGDKNYTKSLAAGYGDSKRNIGNLASGSVDAVVTSPPFLAAKSDTTTTSRGLAETGYTARGRDERVHDRTYLAGRGEHRTPGNVEMLPPGSIDAVVTSPPFGDEQPCASQTRAKQNYHAFTCGDGAKRDQVQRSDGNIATLGAGETYWQAMDQVYRQCLLALRPGGVMAVVVKDYVKNKARVPLCDQTMRLLQHIGFEPIVRIRAMLVKETKHAGLFGEHVDRKERKSFFRRLAEKKGSPRIDWEEVLVVRAPVLRSLPLAQDIDPPIEGIGLEGVLT